MVTSVHKTSKNWIDDLGISEEAREDGVHDSLQSSSDVSSLSFVELLSDFVDTVNSLSEDEHVVLSNLLSDLNIGAIHGSNNKTSVHDELHVGSS